MPPENADAQNEPTGAQPQDQRVASAQRAEIAAQMAEAEAEQTVITELPDEDGESANIKAQAEKEKAELLERLKKVEAEKETFDKRLRDTQHKLHMVTAEKSRGPEPAQVEKPKQTFEEYVNTVVKTFEDEPQAAVKRIISDFAADRDELRRQHKAEMEEMRESIMQEMMMQNPENAQMMALVEELNVARPDMANLTTKQKLEFVKLMHGTKKPGGNGDGVREESSFDRSLIEPSRRNATKSGGLPAWVNDPEVQRQAVGHFGSKREMIDWTDPVKALAMAKKMAAQRED